MTNPRRGRDPGKSGAPSRHIGPVRAGGLVRAEPRHGLYDMDIPVTARSVRLGPFVIPRWWLLALFVLAGSVVLAVELVDQRVVERQVALLALWLFEPGDWRSDPKQLSEYLAGWAAMLGGLTVIWFLFHVRLAPADGLEVWQRGIRSFSKHGIMTIVWDDVVRQSDEPHDLWVDSVGPGGKARRTGVCFDVLISGHIKRVWMFPNLRVVPGVPRKMGAADAPNHGNEPHLRSAVLAGIAHARPDLRVPSEVFHALRVSPRTLVRDLRPWFMGAGIFAACVAVVVATIDLSDPATNVWYPLLVGAAVMVGGVVLHVLLVRAIFDDACTGEVKMARSDAAQRILRRVPIGTHLRSWSSE